MRYGQRVPRADSERYWDERAKQNALFFVDNEIGYDDPDEDAFWQRGEQVVERMLGLVGLEIAAGETVLDIGCGVGRLTRALSRRAGRVIGLDVSQEMLTRAHDHNAYLTNVRWVHGDGASLAAIDDGSVDGCFSHVVFQHIPDPEVTLSYVRDMGRVLRPGGWALFQVSTDPAVHEPPDPGIRGRLRRGLGRGGEPPREWWGSAVEPDALKQAAGDGGLTIEQLRDEGSQYTTVYARRLS